MAAWKTEMHRHPQKLRLGKSKDLMARQKINKIDSNMEF